MSGNVSRRDSKYAFKELTPRRRRMYLRRMTVILVLIAAAITAGCLLHIDAECSLGLEPLPEVAYSEPATAEPIEPEYPLYDIPLSSDLQQRTYGRCLEKDIDPIMVYAIVEVESNYQSDLISETGDYGLMQINESNMAYLTDAIGTIDFLDSEQNIEAGIFWLSGIYENYSDPNKILMVYNMGGSIAQALMDEGRESTWYSREVLKTMDEIRERRVLI